MNLVCWGDGDIPAFIELADGNQCDKPRFVSLMQEFQSQWNFDGLHVADSALYSEANLQQLSGLKWLSRVPLTLNAASQVVTDLPDCAFSTTPLEGYRIATVCSDCGGGKQRWFMVESQSRKHADVQQLEKTLNKSTSQGQRQLHRLCAQEFACEADSLKELEQFEQSLKWHQLVSKGVKPVLHYETHGKLKRGTPPTPPSHILIILVPNWSSIPSSWPNTNSGADALSSPTISWRTTN